MQELERDKPSCSNCEHGFAARVNASARCLKFDIVPPEDVIKEGCDEWTYDEIPF